MIAVRLARPGLPQVRVRPRVRAVTTRLSLVSRRWGRDLLALVGVGCVAIGLSTISVALAWLAVGVFLLMAAGTGRRPKADG